MSANTARNQQMFVNGELVDAIDGGKFEKRNPFTGEVIARVAAAGRQDAARAVEAAFAAFPAWSATPPGARRSLFLKAAGVMDSRQSEIARLITEETGGTFGWGIFNCILAAGILREAAAQTYGLVGEIIPSDLPDTVAMATRQPVGVVVGIAPWNAPLILGVRAVALPLAYGNTVVLKASEESPGTHLVIADVLREAGFPKGVINVITNAPKDAADVVDELIAHPKTRRINFTGSTKVGRIIAEKAAKYLKRTVLELGGKAPLIVLEDAELDSAVAAAKFGAFMNQGQICMSTERIIVERPIAEEFARKLVAKTTTLKVGDPLQPDTQIGPVINRSAIERLEALVADALGKGAKLLCGGKSEGTCFTPTVLYGVTKNMRIYFEESFGPVVSIVIAEDSEDALRIANHTEYGLSGAIYSRDINNAMKIAERLETGMCHINSSTVHDEPQMPFGGVKDSGWGRFGGKAVLDEFTELRWITITRSPISYPL
ncbi:MAG TPA: aldehyde dehydrogenase [Candidatus Acidoferrales bacterium]|nr:aldehyde dehydrogenase [Candidatus Acidoferrales bacterium]